MKLVEILAKELGEWPEGVTHAVQDHKKPYKRKVWLCTGDMVNTTHSEKEWMLGSGVFPKSCSFIADELATDHATAIVTREMWQAERDKAASYVSVDEAKAYLNASVTWVGDMRADPRHNRDRIREIDATIEAMTAERAELVSKLAGEGFALIVPAAEPVEDMGDWRNWKVGDLIESLGDSGGYSLGNTYTVKGFDYDRDVVHTKTDERGSKTNGWRHYMFKFHSRPSA